ncbi:hypothetical protein DB346_14350 [Verrucomicrobia bacterium LW23]|nr:hypothetical protein DB346_14350 [Verrucomicrobia bacterium LW23]
MRNIASSAHELILALALAILALAPAAPACGQDALPPADVLREAKGTLQAPAAALLQAVEKNEGSAKIQDAARSLIKAGGLDLVLGLLSNRFDFSELDIACVVGELKSKKAAQALLKRYINSDDTPIWRGEDELYFRSQARIVIEEALTKMTGVEAQPQWTFEQRITAYALAIKKMKSRT